MPHVMMSKSAGCATTPFTQRLGQTRTVTNPVTLLNNNLHQLSTRTSCVVQQVDDDAHHHQLVEKV